MPIVNKALSSHYLKKRVRLLQALLLLRDKSTPKPMTKQANQLVELRWKWEKYAINYDNAIAKGSSQKQMRNMMIPNQTIPINQNPLQEWKKYIVS